MSMFLTDEQKEEIDNLAYSINNGYFDIFDVMARLSPLMTTSLFDKLKWDMDKIIEETLKAKKSRENK